MKYPCPIFGVGGPTILGPPGLLCDPHEVLAERLVRAYDPRHSTGRNHRVAQFLKARTLGIPVPTGSAPKLSRREKFRLAKRVRKAKKTLRRDNDQAV